MRLNTAHSDDSDSTLAYVLQVDQQQGYEDNWEQSNLDKIGEETINLMKDIPDRGQNNIYAQ